ncbi:MAG: ParB/RepB/Spo0J family partition protein [Mesorhizobium sp.]|nr:MAG: ParB/RepB/Spo0J family partition protein [Mesorhizobium sp.]RWI26139.1 MAG: ParB/RepB/Spo0J family partition protein [Mesorhizobium sp.]
MLLGNSLPRSPTMKKRIPLNLVIPNPDQPRKHFDPAKLRELAESIRERGLIQAITVRPVFLTDGRIEEITSENIAEWNTLLDLQSKSSPTRPASSTERERSASKATGSASSSASQSQTTAQRSADGCETHGAWAPSLHHTESFTGKPGSNGSGPSRRRERSSTSSIVAFPTSTSNEARQSKSELESTTSSTTGIGAGGRRRKSNSSEINGGGTTTGSANSSDEALQASDINVEPSASPSRRAVYEIVGGERRWRAHHLIEAADILCEVVKIDDNEMALQAIVENLARADIKPLEEARAFQAMIDRGWTVEQLAKDIGVQPTRIKARTALLNLDETIQKLVDSGAFPLGHANDLVDLPTADQVNIVRLFSSGKLKDWSSIKAAAQAVRDRIEQGGMFDDDRPESSKDDIAAMSRMEKTVERIIAAIAGGFKDGECIALKSVDPTKADKWADTLAAASRSIRSMESQLRQAHARSMLV